MIMNFYEVHLTWRTIKENSWGTVHCKSIPIVKIRRAKGDHSETLNRSQWILMVFSGDLHVSPELRKWLDENGYENVKPKEIKNQRPSIYPTPDEVSDKMLSVLKSRGVYDTDTGSDVLRKCWYEFGFTDAMKWIQSRDQKEG